MEPNQFYISRFLPILNSAKRNNKSLTEIKIWNRYANPQDFKHLVDALYKNTHVRILSLRDCAMGPKEAEILADLLTNNSSIECLFLPFNNIGDEGAAHLAKMLKNTSSIKGLDLSCNNIGNEGAKVLAEALKVNRSLQAFNLQGNWIGFAGASALLNSLKYHNRSVTLIEPGMRTVKNSEMFQALASANSLWSIWEMSHLEYNSYLQWLPQEMVEDIKILMAENADSENLYIEEEIVSRTTRVWPPNVPENTWGPALLEEDPLLPNTAEEMGAITCCILA